jgi:hypothetical protein
VKAIRSSKHAVIARSRVRTFAGVGAVAMSLAAGLIASAPGASALTEYSTPAITVAAGNSVIAVQTSGDGLRFYWNQYGTDTWRGEQVAPNRTTFSAPSIAQDGNTVVIAVQGAHNSLDFYWALNGTSTWYAETVAGAFTTYSAPSLAVNGGGVNIVAQGPANSLDFYWALNGTSAWHAETVAPARTTFSAPAVASNGGAANVVAQGWDNSLVFYWQQNGTTQWNREGVAGMGTTYSAPAITGNDGFANVAVQGPRNSLDFYWQQNDTSAWNLQVVDPGDSLFGGPPGDDGPPAITTYSDGFDDAVKVLAQGVFLTEWTAFNGGGNWSWQHVNTDFAYAGATITENNGSDNIAVFGNGGELDFYWLDDKGAFQKEVVAAAGVN